MMFDVKPQGEATETDWWTMSNWLLKASQFIEKLHDYEPSKMSPDLINRMKPLLAKDELDPQALRSVSEAAMCLSKWANYMRDCAEISFKSETIKFDIENARAEYEQLLQNVEYKEKHLMLQEEYI